MKLPARFVVKTVLFLVAVFCFAAANQTAAQTVASGTTGSCTWTLTGTDPNLTLTIAPTDGVTGAMDDYSINAMPWYSYRTNITTLDIQSGVTHIGNYAFYSCNGLTGLTIPNSVNTIGTAAFSYRIGLTGTLTILYSVTSIGQYAFQNCGGLTSFFVDASNTIYSSDADGVLFNYNKTALICYPAGKTGNYTIPNSVITIGINAFSGCSGLTIIDVDAANAEYSTADGVLFNKDQTRLIAFPGGKAGGKSGSYTISPSVTSISHWSFKKCRGLTSVTIPSSVIFIGDEAFYGCRGLTVINVDAANTEYSTSGGTLFNKDQTGLIAFPGGKTGSYTIPPSVTSIGNSAFSVCHDLTSVTIPSSVTSIGSNAFYACSGLTKIVSLCATPPSIYPSTFSDAIKDNCVLKVPASSLDLYRAASGWKDFRNIQALSSTLSYDAQVGTVGMTSQPTVYGAAVNEISSLKVDIQLYHSMPIFKF